jgi:hypothetical protein
MDGRLDRANLSERSEIFHIFSKIIMEIVDRISEQKKRKIEEIF